MYEMPRMLWGDPQLRKGIWQHKHLWNSIVPSRVFDILYNSVISVKSQMEVHIHNPVTCIFVLFVKS